MNHIKSLLLGAAALGSLVFTGCSTDVDPVPVNIPEANIVPNTSLLELKTKFWDDATNYIDTIGLREDGSHYIIAGRVISNDEEGNVFKSLTIQDETCALAFSINTYNLYLDYRVGQEIVIDATDMFIGKYNGLQQMGEPEWYENGNAWEASFMAPEFFKLHAQLNGLPEPTKVDTIEINSFSELPSDPEGLRKFQSQLVKFNNVYFEEGGKEQFSTYKSSGVNHNIIDTEGASLPVRTSGYSKFWNKYLPTGNGDVVCLLGYYGTTGWQLTLIDYAGCMNFGNPTIAPGSKDTPYSVTDAIAVEASGKSPSGWVTGYIVGTVAPEVVDINSSDDIEWTAEPTLANTLVIAADPECTDVAQAIVLSLPQDSKLRQYAALRDNPGVYKKQIWLYGKLEPYMGSWGLTDNKGTVDQFRIDGVEIGGGSAANGDGSKDSPYNVQQVLGGSATGTAWVTGYIVGTVTDKSIQTDSEFGTANASNTNVLIAMTAEETDYTKCVPLQLPAGDIRNAISLQQHPDNLGKSVSVYGSIEKYFGVMGVKTITEYTLGEGGGTGGDDPVTPPSTGSGDGSAESPFDVPAAIAAYNANTTGTFWVEGYIVGQCPSQYANETVFSASGETVSNTNFVIAASADVTDIDACLFVQLPTDMRAALSLQQNPGNLGKKVKLFGSLEKYFGKPGLKSLTEYVLGEGGSTGGDDPVTPPASGDGDGSKESPYVVAQVLGGSATGTSWVKGYIVGSVTDKSIQTDSEFGTANASNTNLLLAATPDETDYTKCVPLQLPAGDVRNALSLQQHPENLGKSVSVYGSIEKYFGVTGVKSITEFVFGEGGGNTGGNTGGGDDPVTPPTPGDAVTILATQITNVPGSTTVDGYTIVIDKASGSTAPAAHASTSAIRLYADNTMEISGGTMTSITFTLASDAAYRYTNMACSTGSITPAQAEGDTSFTWVGNASSVTFTVGHDATLGTDGADKRGQIRFTQLDIK